MLETGLGKEELQIIKIGKPTIGYQQQEIFSNLENLLSIKSSLCIEYTIKFAFFIPSEHCIPSSNTIISTSQFYFKRCKLGKLTP